MKIKTLFLLLALQGVVRADVESQFHEYIDRNLGSHRGEFEWRPHSSFTDATHVHRTYRLYYRGRRVLDHVLKLHYNRASDFIEYASSLWERPFHLELGRDSAEMRAELVRRWQSFYASRDGEFQGVVAAEPVIYLEEGTPRLAFEVNLSVFDRGVSRLFIEEEGTGRILEERKASRNVDVTSKAWKVSPFNAANDLAPNDVTLPGLDANTRLKNSYFYVRREQGTTTKALKDVDPRPGTGDFAFSNDPEAYAGTTCQGESTACPNQRVDGTNVYFHLNGFRSKAQSYLANNLQVSPIPLAAFEPIDVIINALSVDVDDDGDLDDETNNAGYFPRTCTTTGGTAIPRCIVFLRPKSGSSVSCGEGQRVFYDLAREAMVIVHEYQHFLIDTIVELVPGAGKKNVGDALHEGYADYFAASHVSDIAGRNVTKIGEYGFQNCKFFQRDIGTVRVYKNGADEIDEHVAGQSWASGLWKLREELGRDKTDLIALKSIFFLNVRPGFYESVEALVKADQALNSGANVSRIRSLFYDQIQWVGGDDSFFKDPSAGVADVGFTSCNAVHSGAGGGTRIPLAILGWLVGVLMLGRRLRRSQRA